MLVMRKKNWRRMEFCEIRTEKRRAFKRVSFDLFPVTSLLGFVATI